MLSDRCAFSLSVLSVLSVCYVGVLWPNGWMNQDATWYRDRPRSKRHCVRLGPSFTLPPKTAQQHQFSAHVYCSQTAGWIKTPQYGDRPWARRYGVRWGPSSPSERDTAAPHFRPMSVVTKRSPISATVELLYYIIFYY